MTRAVTPPASVGRTLLNKVPEVTVFFWVIKVLATTVGETAADYLNVNLGLGLSTTTIVMSVLLIVALYVRLSIDETPVFAEEVRRGAVPRAPLSELLRNQGAQVLLGAGCMVGIFTMSFLGGTYLMNYANTHIGHPRPLVLSAGVLAGVMLAAVQR